MISAILLLLSSIVLGIFLGAQITEAILLVPNWKALKADDFFKFYQNYGQKIHRFFAPLTIVATVLPLLTITYQLANRSENIGLYALMGLSTVAFFSTYFLYFKQANTSFMERELSSKELPHELKRWGHWHWSRIGLEFITFVCSLLLLIAT